MALNVFGRVNPAATFSIDFGSEVETQTAQVKRSASYRAAAIDIGFYTREPLLIIGPSPRALVDTFMMDNVLTQRVRRYNPNATNYWIVPNMRGSGNLYWIQPLEDIVRARRYNVNATDVFFRFTPAAPPSPQPIPNTPDVVRTIRYNWRAGEVFWDPNTKGPSPQPMPGSWGFDLVKAGRYNSRASELTWTSNIVGPSPAQQIEVDWTMGGAGWTDVNNAFSTATETDYGFGNTSAGTDDPFSAI